MFFKANKVYPSFSNLRTELSDFTANTKSKCKIKLNKLKEYFKFLKRFKDQYKYHKMTIPEINHIQIREENPDIDEIIRAILMSRAKNNGMTLEEIRSKFITFLI